MNNFNFKAGDKVYYPAMLNKITTLAKTNFATYPVLVILDPQGKTESHYFTLDGKRYENSDNPSIFPATQEWYDRLVHVYPDLEKPPTKQSAKEIIQAWLAENSEGVSCLLNATPIMPFTSVETLRERMFDAEYDKEIAAAWKSIGIKTLVKGKTMYPLKNITYRFLEPKYLDEAVKCKITAHLDNDNPDGLSTIDYMLTGIELNPNFMTTDRLFMLLNDHYAEREVTDYTDKLEEFVVKFIQDLRKKYDRIMRAN